MGRRLWVCVTGLLALAAGHAQAQRWVAYSPPERDFRVLFPAPPERTTAPDGAVVFTSTFQTDEHAVYYVVHRLPPGLRQADAQGEIQRRVEARVRDEDQAFRVPNAEYGVDWNAQIFRHNRMVTVHRLAGQPGRYYELEVIMPRGRGESFLSTARDYMESFQVIGAVPVKVPGRLATLEQRLATWCQGRTGFARTFCEYSVCLQPGYDSHPQCKTLSIWR